MDEKTISETVIAMDPSARPQLMDPEFLKRLRKINGYIQQDPGIGQGPRLVYMVDEQALFIQLDETTSVGRSEKARCTIDNQELSRIHFEILSDETGYRVKDLFSKNGTQVNDEAVTEKDLISGDIIRAGGQTFLFMTD